MSIVLESFDAARLQNHLYEFVDLLCDVVDHGGSVNFLAPLSGDEAEAYWQKVAADLPTGNRVLLAALDDGVVIGSVQLALATQPNGPHRAEVQKLFVHTSHRRQGISRQLITAIEEQARVHKRTLLVLDTERGSYAEPLYRTMGYQTVGIIPGFALNTSGELRDCVVFYKTLG